MKTVRYASLLLALLTLSAATLPAPAPTPLAATGQPAVPADFGLLVARYRWLRHTELPGLLAWLQSWGPFTQPPPGLLPEQPQAHLATSWAAAP